jgi:hypothetical protein
VHPRLETPTVRSFLEGIFVADFPVNDISLPGLVRDRQQRGGRIRAPGSGLLPRG